MVECTIEHASLDDGPSYIALSYTWGKVSASRPILVDGHEVSVTENLLSALEHLRHEERILNFWIDALSINQLDNEEKSWQVMQMLTIYRAASQVIVWLGPSTGDSDLAMERLIILGEKIQLSGELEEHDAYKSIMSINNETMMIKCTSVFRGNFELVYNEVEQAKEWVIPGVNNLLHRSWWTRVWVLQELAAARQVVFACGHKIVPERYMYLSLGILFAYRDLLMSGKLRINASDMLLTFSRRQWSSWVEDSRPIAQLRCREFCRDAEKNSHLFTLKQLLRLICLSSSEDSMGATDSRDRVYALLGLASDGPGLGIHVNYTLPAPEIYLEATTAMLRSETLSLREVLSLSKFPKKEATLPSWVPDWSLRIEEPLQERLPRYKKPLSSFTPEIKAFEQLKDSIVRSSSPRCLFVPAIIVDSIAHIATPWKTCLDERHALDQTSLISWLAEIQSLASTQLPNVYDSPSAREEAIWRTLILDAEMNVNRRWVHAEADLKSAYLMLIKGQIKHRSRRRKNVPAYVELVDAANEERRFCVSETGYLALAPDGVEQGDLIAIVPGADVPFIFRRLKAEAHPEKYELVGEAYVHGLMHGEWFGRDNGAGQEETDVGSSRWNTLKTLEVH